MGDISIIEFGVYGFLCYASFLMLIISIIKEAPNTKIQSIARSIFIVPGMICAGILASSGINIQVANVTTNNLIRSVNTTQTWTEATTQINNVVLQNPIWTTVHVMLFLIMLTYIIFQFVNLMVKKN